MPVFDPNINEQLQKRFDKIFVVTVPRFKERQQAVSEQLKGLTFDFFYGKDKNDLSREFLLENYSYDPNKSLSIVKKFPSLNVGEIACALSHRSIYEEMVKNSWGSVLIFEDDVLPAWAHITSLIPTINELPEDWGLIYLGYLKNQKAGLANRLKVLWYQLQAIFGLTVMNRKMINRILPRGYSAHLRKAGFHDCTHAYAVTLDAARKLIAAQTPVTYRADNLLSAMIMSGQMEGFISKNIFFEQEIFSNDEHTSHVREGETKH
jgi:glycosyl transferase family 25